MQRVVCVTKYYLLVGVAVTLRDMSRESRVTTSPPVTLPSHTLEAASWTPSSCSGSWQS